MNILFYGNCQLLAVQKLLNLHNVVDEYIECYKTDLDENNFKNIIKKQDIIITQPIKEDYRNKNFLSTKFVIDNCKENCKIIIFDSCYFHFYYFDLNYKDFNNEILHQPSDYHYAEMINCFKNNLPIEHYIENYVKNINLKSKEELEKYANDGLNDLERRYHDNIKNYKIKDTIFIISIYYFIKNNYKEKLLFYSMNHPSKFVILFICEEIIKILNFKNSILYNVNVLDYPKCIIYDCVQKAVNFNINECELLLDGKKNVYDITKLYYDTYKNIGFKG